MSQPQDIRDQSGQVAGTITNVEVIGDTLRVELSIKRQAIINPHEVFVPAIQSIIDKAIKCYKCSTTRTIKCRFCSKRICRAHVCVNLKDTCLDCEGREDYLKCDWCDREVTCIDRVGVIDGIVLASCGFNHEKERAERYGSLPVANQELPGRGPLPEVEPGEVKVDEPLASVDPVEYYRNKMSSPPTFGQEFDYAVALRWSKDHDNQLKALEIFNRRLKNYPGHLSLRRHTLLLSKDLGVPCFLPLINKEHK